MKRYLTPAYLLVILAILSACNPVKENSRDQITSSPSPIPPSLTQHPAKTETPQPPSSDTPSPTTAPSETPVVILPPEPIEILFSASDGQELQGLYFPANQDPAPIIVLMPWSRGNQSEWEEIAYWLQGRGLLVREPNYARTWKSSNWYPKRTLSMPLGVFTFDFRSCEAEDGCQAYLPAEWLLDAQAALLTASQLQGVDPDRILAAGASIGADGAVDACAWMSSTDLGTCLGGFAISPSSSLTIDFRTAVEAITAQETPGIVYCLYGSLDDAARETCGIEIELKSINLGYIENHGLELITFTRSPDTLDYLQEFILAGLGGAQ